jgi:hypothetical protein
MTGVVSGRMDPISCIQLEYKRRIGRSRVDLEINGSSPAEAQSHAARGGRGKSAKIRESSTDLGALYIRPPRSIVHLAASTASPGSKLPPPPWLCRDDSPPDVQMLDRAVS